MTYSGLDLSNPAAPVPTVSDQPYSKYYKGKAAAPVIPSVFAAYKKGDWTISGFFAITAGGGKVHLMTVYLYLSRLLWQKYSKRVWME